MKRALLAGVLLCCAALLAGFGGQGGDFGKLGAGFGRPGPKKPSGACSNALIFNVTCNSQYEIIIH